MFDALILTAQFLTRLPIKINVEVKRDTMAKGTVFYSYIGMLVGLIAGAVYFFLWRINSDLAAAAAVLAIIAVTGGFHVDGLSDTCDGFFSSRSRERILEIMKDSRVGTFGVIAIVFDILLKFVLLKGFNRIDGAICLILVCGNARLAASMLFSFGKIARPNGLGAMLTENNSRKYFFIGLITYTIIGTFIMKYYFLIVLLITLLAALLLMRYSYKVIGGLTGDVYGACCEIGEIIGLFGFTVLFMYFR